jgi:hypothetical protein
LYPEKAHLLEYQSKNMMKLDYVSKKKTLRDLGEQVPASAGSPYRVRVKSGAGQIIAFFDFGN